MTSALRWAATRPILMFHNCEGQSHKTMSTDHNLWSKRRAEADSNWGPSAYQPTALPLGQTGSQSPYYTTLKHWQVSRTTIPQLNVQMTVEILKERERERERRKTAKVFDWPVAFSKVKRKSCQKSPQTLDLSFNWPIHRPTRSPISTNQRREMLLFLARTFVPHAVIANNGSAHTIPVRFCRFWFSHPNTAKWLYGCLQGNQLWAISSSSNFYGWSSDTTDKTWDLFFLLFLLLSLSFLFFFFLSLYRLVRFMAFQSVLVGTTPAFTIIINSTKR